MKRILLLGKHGQLGWELQRTLMPLGEVLALDYPEIDLADPRALFGRIEDLRPQVIVNAAAYTAVDRAEAEPQLARRINAEAPMLLAEATRTLGAALVHYSTDFVYDGKKTYAYTEKDTPAPLSVYGKTKLAGDDAIEAAGGAYLILRSSWLYGLRGDNFLTKLLHWMRSQSEVKVVSDQTGCPTWARGVAEASAQILAQAHADTAGWLRERHGVYHLSNRGSATRFEWAQAVRSLDPKPQEHKVVRLLPAATTEFPAPAARPTFSVLDCSKLSTTFSLALPHWQQGLSLALGCDTLPAPAWEAKSRTGGVP